MILVTVIYNLSFS